MQMVELSMPLHTLIELEPRPDGTMVERRYKINIDSTSDDDVRFDHSSTLHRLPDARFGAFRVIKGRLLPQLWLCVAVAL